MLAFLYTVIDGAHIVLYLSRSVLVVYGSAFAGTLLVAVEVPSSVTSLGAVRWLVVLLYEHLFVVEPNLISSQPASLFNRATFTLKMTSFK